jgi:8-oxo-dGTP pyrophosphatase MutT (NUDIX family)
MQIKRSSYGIACCRYNLQKTCYEILMVKRRYTFAYSKFVNGTYSRIPSNSELLYMFNRMTIEEKLEIRSLNFGRMWYRIWNSDPGIENVIYKRYLHHKKTFSRLIAHNRDKLLDLLSKSTNQDSLWEIPKGKKLNPQELNLNCAVREMQEETHVSPEAYTLLPNIEPLRIAHTDQRIRYLMEYYVAIAKQGKVQPYIDYNSNQTNEVVDVRWMSLNDLKMLDFTGRYLNMARRIFRILKARYKISKF